MRLGGSGILLAVPGILVPGIAQMSPLMPLFVQHGLEVRALEYGGVHFDSELCAADIATGVEHALADSPRVTVLASSLGGMLAALALERIGAAVDDVRWLIVDSPSSSRDLVVAPLPAGANSAVGWLSRKIRPSAKANESYGRWLLSKMAVPPKDEAIEVPNDFTGLVAKGYRDGVKRTAMQNLTTTPFTLWYEQVRWMLACEGLPVDGFDGLDATYFACVRANATVRQPDASRVWQSHVSKVVQVPTAHCAYAEAKYTWMQALDAELSRI